MRLATVSVSRRVMTCEYLREALAAGHRIDAINTAQTTLKRFTWEPLRSGQATATTTMPMATMRPPQAATAVPR